MSKRLLSIMIAALLLLVMAAPALAVPSAVTYGNTRSFLEALDELELKYTYGGIDQDNDEKVTIETTLEDTDKSIEIFFYFSEDEELCSIRVWNLIDFDEENLAELYKICNDLNAGYKYCKFYVDESDYSISVDLDVILRSTDSADICSEALAHIYNICTYAMEDLSPYAK